ncbi:hypothetical protein [Halorubrum salsamenti]|uniref:hypothetical protein n=1 Tax=Halorubrum salsamenti TaxID=2583990 RepID=UPI0011A1941C|nr:hypothetical protein [Halorubrum salsamenti]
MSGPEPSRSESDPGARTEWCTHCGDPAFGRVSLVFERESGSREIDLWLCGRCMDSFTAEPGVRLAE